MRSLLLFPRRQSPHSEQNPRRCVSRFEAISRNRPRGAQQRERRLQSCPDEQTRAGRQKDHHGQTDGRRQSQLGAPPSPLRRRLVGCRFWRVPQTDPQHSRLELQSLRDHHSQFAAHECASLRFRDRRWWRQALDECDRADAESGPHSLEAAPGASQTDAGSETDEEGSSGDDAGSGAAAIWSPVEADEI